MTVTQYKKVLHKRDEKITELDEKITVLEETNGQLDQENIELKSSNAELKEELKWQKAKYEALERRVFGSKSEKLTEEDRQNFLPALEEVPGELYQAPEEKTFTRTTQKIETAGGIRANIPEHIERVRVELIPEVVQQNPQDFVKIGEDVTRRLDYIPGKLICKEYVSGKYKNQQNDFIQQPVPPTIADK